LASVASLFSVCPGGLGTPLADSERILFPSSLIGPFGLPLRALRIFSFVSSDLLRPIWALDILDLAVSVCFLPVAAILFFSYFYL
jgi:hypothetical protein